jgi:hypothetical protein
MRRSSKLRVRPTSKVACKSTLATLAARRAKYQ